VDEVPIEDTLAALDYLASLLPPRQSVVVLLADVFEFHLDEVARMLSVSRSATKALLQRGRCTPRKADIDSPAEFVGRRRPAPDGFTAKYIDAFNRRDPDGIAALFHEDVFVEMLGAVGDLHGRQFTRDDALRQWAADPRPQWTEAGEFAGKAAMFVFTRDSAGAELLHRISRFEVEDGQALRAWEYYMAPELLTMAAHALGIEPDLHGYTFAELT
jgi:RNA polymerase sigma-70 factor (ECF subfamily)